MARKKHLLEVLLEASRADGAPLPERAARPRPRPDKAPRRSLRSRLDAFRRWRVWLPAQAGVFVIVGLVVTLVVAGSVGLFRTHAGDLGGPEIATKAPDPLATMRAAAPAALPEAPIAAAPEEVREWGIKVVTYDNRESNHPYARATVAYLQEQGIPDVQAWTDVPDSSGRKWVIVYAGAFPAKSDPALEPLLRQIRALPGARGKGEKPYESAMIERLPRVEAPR